MVVRRGINEASIVPMARWARAEGLILRFIEYMDVGHSNGWRLDEVVPGGRDRRGDRRRACRSSPSPPNYPGEVAGPLARTPDGGGEVGVIASVTRAVLRRLHPGPDLGRRPAVHLPVRGQGHRPARARSASGATDAELTAAIRAVWSVRARPLLGAPLRGDRATCPRSRCSRWAASRPDPPPARSSAPPVRPQASTPVQRDLWTRPRTLRGQSRWPDVSTDRRTARSGGQAGAQATSWTSALTLPGRPYRRSCPKGPSGTRALEITSTVSRPTGRFGRFASRASAISPSRASGARRDVTGIPVSVLPPGERRTARLVRAEARSVSGSGAAIPAVGVPRGARMTRGHDRRRSAPARSRPSSSRPGSPRSRRPSGPGRDLVPEVGIVLGSGLGGLADDLGRPGRDPVRGPARLAGGDRARPRRAAPPRPARRGPGRDAPGPAPPLRGQRPRPGRPAGPADGPARGADRRPDQRRRRRRPGLRPGHADDHQRPPQPDRPDAAARAERRRDRSPVHRPDRRLEPAPARAPARGRSRPRASTPRGRLRRPARADLRDPGRGPDAADAGRRRGRDVDRRSRRSPRAGPGSRSAACRS